MNRGFGAERGELEDGLNLFPSYTKFFTQFIDAHVLQVLEDC